MRQAVKVLCEFLKNGQKSRDNLRIYPANLFFE
jgi:hypothetical protein